LQLNSVALLGTQTPTPRQLWAADCNNNKAVNVIDVQRSINHLNGIQEVVGSNPISSTSKIKGLAAEAGPFCFDSRTASAIIPLSKS